MDKDKTFWEKVEVTVSAKWFAIAIFFVGIVVYALLQLPDTKNMGKFFTILIDVCKVISAMFITTGALTLMLRITTMKRDLQNIVNNAMDRVITNIIRLDVELQSFDSTILNSLRKKIILHITDNKQMDINMLDKSIYSLEGHLQKLTKGLYWEFNNRTTIITPDSKQNVFKKKVISKYKIVNLYGLDNSIEFAMILMKGSDTSNFKMTNFKINDKNLSSEIKNFTKMEKINGEFHTPYTHEIIFRKELQKCKEHTVEFTYQYSVPIYDLSHSYKLSKPCKNLEHKFMIDGGEANDWELDVQGFASLFYDESEIKDKFKADMETEKSAFIKFDEWVLPGAGYVVNINKKSNKGEV